MIEPSLTAPSKAPVGKPLSNASELRFTLASNLQSVTHAGSGGDNGNRRYNEVFRYKFCYETSSRSSSAT
jgi:hypothetical protein